MIFTIQRKLMRCYQKFDEYQLATGNMSDFEWIHQTGPFNKKKIITDGYTPVR